MLRAIQLTALAALVATMLAPAVRGQTDKTKLDRVYFLNPETKKEDDVYGKIEDETPSGVKLKVREGKEDKVKTVSADIITRIYYYTPEVPAIEFNAGSVSEMNWEKASGKKKDELFTSAMTKYAAVEKQLSGRGEARRYMQYRIAMLLAKASRENPARADEALKHLKDFTSANRSGWQIVPALTTQARMLEEAGRADDAREAYEGLASLTGLSPALTRQARLNVGKLSLRAGKYADAQKSLEAMAGSLSGADPEKPFVEAYLAESKIGQGKLDGADAALAGVLKVSSDAKLRGLVHNLLGDWSEKKGQVDDAFWHYLRVDALYTEDAEEHARALFRLAELFDKVKKDPVRAQDCARKLMSAAFDGTRFQKMGKAAGMKGEEKTPDN